jgi:hypothetical protein
VQAGILEERYGDSDVPAAVLSDAHLQERQKQVLLELYEAYRRENDAATAAVDTLVEAVVETAEPATPTPAVSPPVTKPSRTRTARRAKPRTASVAADVLSSPDSPVVTQ